MVALCVIRKHMFANNHVSMVERVLLFADESSATIWEENHPVDTEMEVGNAYMYERVVPELKES